MPSLISGGWSIDTTREMIGRSCSASPSPWPNCSPKADISSGNPNSGAFGLMKRHAEEIASIIREAGVADMPIGVDIIEPPMLFELEKAGLKIADGQQTMLEAREIKSIDEIALLNRSAAMVDGAILVIGAGKTPYKLITRAIDALGREKIRGVVLNRVNRSCLAGGYGYGYYSYGDR